MKIILKIISIPIFGVLLLFLVDGFETEKYQVYRLLHAPFQKEYEKSAYYDFKVPKEWVQTCDNDDDKCYLGPTWTESQKPTKVTVVTNYDKLINYIDYFDSSLCINKTSVDINSSAIVKLEKKTSLFLPAKLLFCENKNSYVSYKNDGTMTYIFVKPYDAKYKKQYIELFKKIDFIIEEKNIPEWVYQ